MTGAVVVAPAVVMAAVVMAAVVMAAVVMAAVVMAAVVMARRVVSSVARAGNAYSPKAQRKAGRGGRKQSSDPSQHFVPPFRSSSSLVPTIAGGQSAFQVDFGPTTTSPASGRDAAVT